MNNSINIIKKLFLTLGLCVTLSAHANSVISIVVEDKYEDIRGNLIDAIEQKAINISKIYHASDMLNRTQSEVFNIENIYNKAKSSFDKMLNPLASKPKNNISISPIYKKAEIIAFCSAKISHELVIANPLNISLCPFEIALYTLNSAPNQTHIVYTKLKALDKQSEKATTDANELIKSLVESASW